MFMRVSKATGKAVVYIIVRLHNIGIYRIYNLKVVGCGTQAK